MRDIKVKELFIVPNFDVYNPLYRDFSRVFERLESSNTNMSFRWTNVRV